MAGQEQRGSRDRERSSRAASPSASVAAVSEVAPGSEAIIPTSSTAPVPTTSAATVPTARAIWRLLQMKGMTPDEAANLTAFLYGLPTADQRWSIGQLNQLLFLREMRQAGRFGRDDGTPLLSA